MRYWPRLRWEQGKIEIGDHIWVRCGIVIDAQNGDIKIGNNVSINDYSILLGHGGITVGNNVRIAAHVAIASFEHVYDDPAVPIMHQGIRKARVTIDDDVWIGAGTKVLAGCHIAQGCVIGANSVVKGETVPFGVYVGAPARLVKLRTDQRA